MSRGARLAGWLVAAGLWLASDPVQAQPVYSVFRTTLSLPYTAQIANGQGGSTLVNGRLTNKQFLNLAQGRALGAAVPSNEILVVLTPTDYQFERTSTFAVFDKNTKQVLKRLTAAGEVSTGFGKPDGNGFVFYTTGYLPDALVGPDFGIATASVSATVKGIERSGKAEVIASRAQSMVGELEVMINGVSAPALTMNARVRVFGRSLAAIQDLPF